MVTKSHLDVECPKFESSPHIWVQWKGTDVCCDVHCTCGHSGHVDGYFFYYYRCPGCDKVWEVGSHVMLYEVDGERAKEVGEAAIRTDNDQYED